MVFQCLQRWKVIINLNSWKTELNSNSNIPRPSLVMIQCSQIPDRKWRWTAPDTIPANSIFVFEWMRWSWFSSSLCCQVITLLGEDPLVLNAPLRPISEKTGCALKALAGVRLRPCRLTGTQRAPNRVIYPGPTLTRSTASVPLHPWTTSDSEIYFNNMFCWSLSDSWTDWHSNNNKSSKETHRNVLSVAILEH